MQRVPRLRAALALLLPLGLAGCEQRSVEAKPPPPPSPAESRADAATAPVSTSSSGPTSFEKELTRHTRERYTGDLAAIKQHKVLRVLTRNNSSAYFISKGQERGLQYELAKAFADDLGVRLAMVVPPSRSELSAALLAGEGDLIAAGMTVTTTRAKQVRFTAPVSTTPRVLVSRTDFPSPIKDLSALRSVPIHLSFRSTTYGSIKALEQQLGFPLQLIDVPDDIEMEQMMIHASTGEYQLTVADQDLAELEIAGGLDIAVRFVIGEPLGKAWAVRPDAPELAEAADKFIRLHKKDGLIKILYDRYYKPSGNQKGKKGRDLEFRADASGKISPFDEIFRREGQRVGIDWRLLAAIAYTESKFDPRVKSPFGAVGLMQLLPTTALEMGVRDPEKPGPNIHAGASYFKTLADSFNSPGLEERQRIRFAIAAYNAGPGHIHDARLLAEKTHRDPNIWFGSVEHALRLKMNPHWNEQTRYGYVRAEEPIQYVSRVQARYDVFARHVSAD